jgi:cytochrome c-type biogenesis protein CcmH/NrfG
MTGWILVAAMALAILAALWRFARLDRSTAQFIASALLLALAGYAWQGSPGLAGSPKHGPESVVIPDSDFAAMRREMMGRFDSADRWLSVAEVYQRGGDTRNGALAVQRGLHFHPRDPNLWVGYGNALVMHAGGLMTPAAELAFRRAAEIAPDHPGPKFFYGLALAQAGRFDEAERIWRDLLASAPPSAAWRGAIEERLQMLEQAKAMGEAGR